MSALSILVTSVCLHAANGPGLMDEIDTLDHRLVQLEHQLKNATEQQLQFENELAAIDAQMASCRLRYDKAYTALAKRLRVLYRLPSATRWLILRGVYGLADYFDISRMLRFVTRVDRQLMKNAAREREQLADLQLKARLKQEQLADKVDKAKIARDDIAKERRAKVDLLALIQHQALLQEQWEEEQRVAQSDYAQLMTRLRPTQPLALQFARNRGKLPWPTLGNVSVFFGDRAEKTFGTTTSHGGIDIKAPIGSSVYAVAPGVVAHADWIRGFGQVVIIDHGDHYYSVMGHLADVQAQAGDVVIMGQSVGRVGDTGSVSEAVLYFEIRHGDQALDPLVWLRD